MASTSTGPIFGARDIFNKVELSIACKNLKDMDFFSKSDPVVFLYQKAGLNWEKLGRTEVIDNNLNPKFSRTFILDYHFEEVQTLKFEVYDVDNPNHVDDLRRHDFIGKIECTLADLVTAGQQYTRNIRNQGTITGEIIIAAEEVKDSKFAVHMQLSASKLDKKDFFGKSDPFVEIHKAQESGNFTVVYRSEPIKRSLNPRWKGFSISSLQLCSGDWDRTLKFVVWDWNRSGDHSYIGSCTTTLTDICPERGGQVFCLNIVNEKMKSKKKYQKSGTLNFESVKATPEYSFVDYIKGGCEINLMVAIDFTASNGRPQDPVSLHYTYTNTDSAYMTAIKSVGSVLAPYDTDQLIPVYGFGARIPPMGDISHCFPLTFKEEAPTVLGVKEFIFQVFIHIGSQDANPASIITSHIIACCWLLSLGIMDVYRYALSRIDLYGPTNFSSFLKKAIEMARSTVTQSSQSYNILLVITDGIISDMAKTTECIVEASRLPLSIVIIGVGDADFTNMEVLDADDTPLQNSRGELMARDIVQFVPFKSYQHSQSLLAKETLAEIPEQFLSYMKNSGIKPNPPTLRPRVYSASGSPSGPSSSSQVYPSADLSDPIQSSGDPLPPPYPQPTSSMRQQRPPYPI